METAVPEPESPAELPEDAVVVRGGLMDRQQTIEKAASARPIWGTNGLSVWSVADLSADEIVQLARTYEDLAADPPKRYLPYGQMRVSTVGQLRARGFGLLPDSPFGHYLLAIPTPTAESDWDALQEEFGPAEKSPPR